MKERNPKQRRQLVWTVKNIFKDRSVIELFVNN
jgi:hypothetical protein